MFYLQNRDIDNEFYQRVEKFFSQRANLFAISQLRDGT